MDLFDLQFRRKFSMSMYKNLRLKLAEMSFAKDFVNDSRGDLYPMLWKEDTAFESVDSDTYTVDGGVKRFMCEYFPYATYEITANADDGKVGFCFAIPDCEAVISVGKGKLFYRCDTHEESIDLHNNGEFTMCLSCRPGAFDVYFKNNDKAQYFCTFKETAFNDADLYEVFTNGYAALYADGKVAVKEVLSYIDNGISIADMRTIRYENGEVMVDGGKVYFTASIRLQEQCFQGIFAWVPSTAEIELTGAVFYDSGDGRWCGDVAASVLYHRAENKWYLWVCSFAHEHILGHSIFEGDPRFGVNVIDIELMEKSDKGDNSDFKGIEGDEDPDFFYDEEKNKWFMAICRLDPEINQYRYVFFESDKPFSGYKYLGKGTGDAETGGSFVKINGEQYFICGNSFEKTSDYRVYSKDGVRSAQFNYPDGGFRGWGTVVPVKMGSRIRYFWLTFDRHNGSSYNWSYGNFYCFEAK